MELIVNREFICRHLFVIVLMLGLGGWFGYDGFVVYPTQTARELYAACHKGENPVSDLEAEKFRAQAIPRQKQFMALCLLAAVLIGGHLLLVSRLRFSFDTDGFTWRGERFSFSDVLKTDDSKWKKDGIVRITTPKGTVTLDAWHHRGVEDFHAQLEEHMKGRNGGMADAADLKSAGR